MWNLFAHAAWKVTVVSLVLGVSLPALFAVGVRETVMAGGTDPGTGAPVRAAWLRRAFGIICFVIVLAAVAVGITIIVASGLGKEVSFHNGFPTIVDKS
jgi:putative copper export protein